MSDEYKPKKSAEEAAKGLEACAEDSPNCVKNCPYFDESDCTEDIKRDGAYWLKKALKESIEAEHHDTEQNEESKAYAEALKGLGDMLKKAIEDDEKDEKTEEEERKEFHRFVDEEVNALFHDSPYSFCGVVFKDGNACYVHALHNDSLMKMAHAAQLTLGATIESLCDSSKEKRYKKSVLMAICKKVYEGHYTERIDIGDILEMTHALENRDWEFES